MAASRIDPAANDDFDQLDDRHEPRLPIGAIRVSSDQDEFGRGD